MSYTDRPYPSPASLPPSRQNKAHSQKEYRERELENFNTLRGLIRTLTGEELRTRQEILRKAINLLSSLPESGNQCEGQASTSTVYEAPISTLGPEGMTFAQLLSQLSLSMGQLDETSHQTWAPNVQFDAATYQGTHFHDPEQYYSVSGVNPVLSLCTTSSGYREDSSNERQLRWPFQ